MRSNSTALCVRRIGLFVLAAAFLPALAADITVRKTGGDYSAIQPALDAAAAGDRIVVYGGTYSERLHVAHGGGSAGGYITLAAHSNDTVLLSGSGLHNPTDPHLIQIEDGVSYFRITGLSICSNRADDTDGGSGIYMEGRGDHLEILSNRIYDIRGTNGMAITIYGADPATPVSNLAIVGNEIFNCEPADSEAVTLNGNVTGFTVVSNYIHDVNNIGIDFIGGEAPLPGAARNGVCSDNRVMRANSPHGGGFAAGIYVDGGCDIVIERNLVSGCDVGMEVGAENAGQTATNVTVRNNVLYRNNKVGLAFGGYDETRGRTAFCRFLNNTLYKNGNTDTWQGEIIIQWAGTNDVRNNIVYVSETGNRYAVLNSAGQGNMSNVFDYNLYYLAGSPTNVLFSWNGQTCTGFPSYQAAAGGHEAHSSFQAPVFVNAWATNLALSAGSPAIDAGDPVSAYSAGTLDYALRLRPINGRMDVGALEYPSSWDSAATTVAGGWKWLSWFGYFRDGGGGWIWHAEHGWMYGYGTAPASVWFWSSRLGWLWTGDSLYPFLWSDSQHAWLWYYRGTGTGAGGWFYNYGTGLVEWR